MRTETVKVTCDSCQREILSAQWKRLAEVVDMKRCSMSTGMPRLSLDFCGTECLARWAAEKMNWAVPPERVPTAEDFY